MAILKNLKASRDFGDLCDSLVENIFYSGIHDYEVKVPLFKTHNLTLKEALEMCKSRELAYDRALKLNRTNRFYGK